MSKTEEPKTSIAGMLGCAVIGIVLAFINGLIFVANALGGRCVDGTSGEYVDCGTDYTGLTVFFVSIIIAIIAAVTLLRRR